MISTIKISSPKLRRDAKARVTRETIIRAGKLEIDPATREVTRSGQKVELTATEFDVLLCLIEAKGRVLSREQIQARVWGPDHHGTTRTVDNFLLQLRSKLEDNPTEPAHLVTPGMGHDALFIAKLEGDDPPGSDQRRNRSSFGRFSLRFRRQDRSPFGWMSGISPQRTTNAPRPARPHRVPARVGTCT